MEDQDREARMDEDVEAHKHKAANDEGDDDVEGHWHKHAPAKHKA